MQLFWCQAPSERIFNETINCTNDDNSTYYNYDDSASEEENSDTIKNFLHQYVIFVISVAGIVGNCLSAVVLRCDVERREALFMLFVLAIADTGYLICVILLYPLMYALPSEPYLSVKVIVYPLMRTFQAVTIWQTVLATVERYVYVTRPFLAQRIFTATSRRLFALGVFVAAVAFTAPRFAENCIERYVDDCNKVHVFFSYKAAFLNNRPYRNFYNVGAYLLLLYVLPLATLTFMNLRLVRAVRASLHRRSLTGSDVGISSHALAVAAAGNGDAATVVVAAPDDTGRQAESNATLVLVTIVVVFICCQTSELVIRLLIFTSIMMGINEDVVPSALHGVNELLMVVNSSINFVIYSVFRQRFRVILCRLLTCRAANSNKWRPAAAERVPMIHPQQVPNAKVKRLTRNVH